MADLDISETKVLSAEDKLRVASQVADLNNLKIQYGQNQLNFDSLKDQFEELSRKHGEDTRELRSQILAKHLQLQETTTDLLHKYSVVSEEGGWSLSVSDGAFIRHVENVPKPPRVSARKPKKVK